MKRNRVLVVDDERETCDLLSVALEQDGFEVLALQSANQAIDAVLSQDFALVLTDIGLVEMTGIELCKRLLDVRPGLPVVVVTGQGNLEVAVAAMRAGAFDFITKPVDLKLLALAVERAAKHGELNEEVKRLRLASPVAPSGSGVLGDSPVMRKVYEILERVSDTDASVLIHGETGTGKELVARALHATSRRKEGPFVAINCAAVPHTLLESELFGHARGAFTDAKIARRGLFAQANGGTLFLDEIGELPIDVQAKLLRALQERKIRPIGADEEIEYDARIVTATNRDLEFEVFEKRFREDLFYRINVVTIELPPLRDRGGDVLDLATHFLARFAKQSGRKTLAISQAAAEKLMAYSWPGNVRELENCIERAVALARFDSLTVEDLPEKIKAQAESRFVVAADDPTELVPMEEVERRYILRVLKIMGGNKSRAAQILGLDRRTLYRKIERYEAGGSAEQGPQGRPSSRAGSHAGDDEL